MRISTALVILLAAVNTSAVADPSISEILAANKRAMGGSAWDRKATMVVEADFRGEGLTGTTRSVSDLKTGRSVTNSKIGPSSGAGGFDGVTPWQRDSSGTMTQQTGGDAVALAVNDAYRTANKWWLPNYGGATIEFKGEMTTIAGQEPFHMTDDPYPVYAQIVCDVLTITPKDGKPFTAWFTVESHELRLIEEQQGSQMVKTIYSDYRRESGVLVPHSIVIDRSIGDKYVDTLTVTKVSFESAKPDSYFAMPKTTVSDFSMARGAAATTLPITIVNNHVYGSAKVNGKGPFQFIFDTGGHNIVTPPLAKELGLKMEGQIAGTGAGEGIVEGGLVNGVELDVGDASVKNQIFIVFPLDKLGDIEGVPIPGMVGYETFRRFVTRIDYGADTLTLFDPKKFDPKDSGTPVKFVFNGHVPEVRGTFEGLQAKFDIDTGSRAELTITKPFAETNNLRANHPKGVDAVDGWGVGGPSHAYVTKGAEMTLGAVRIEGIVVSLSTDAKGAFSGSEYSGNVGAGILKRFVVTFDYDHQLMYLKPLPVPVADIGTFDRAGMWINQAGPGFKVVDVTRNAPAELAGIKAGDVIVAVDGVPAGAMHLYDLRFKLRNDPPGTTVSFEILRDQKYHTVKIMLRDLI